MFLVEIEDRVKCDKLHNRVNIYGAMTPIYL